MYFVEDEALTILETVGATTNYPAWVAGQAYTWNDVVSYAGYNYKANYNLSGAINTTPPDANTLYWSRLGAATKRLYVTSLEVPTAIPAWTSGEILAVGDCRVSGTTLFRLSAVPPTWTTAPAAGAYWTSVGAVEAGAPIYDWSPGMTKVVNRIVFDPYSNRCYRTKVTTGSGTTVRPSIEIRANPTYWDDLGIWRRLSDYGDWISGLAVAQGECRYDPASNNDYYCTTELSAAQNTLRPSAAVGSADPIVAARWYDMGAANAFRAYDREILATMKTGQRSMWTAFKTVATGLCNCVGVFGMRGIESVRVRAWTLSQNIATDTPLYDQTKSALHTSQVNGGADYWGRGALAFKIPSLNYGLQIRVDFACMSWLVAGGDRSWIAVGAIVAGCAIEMGATVAEFEATSADFSRKETDDYGNTKIAWRGYARQVTADVVIPTANLDAWKRRLDFYRASPCMYNLNNDGTDFESLILYGLYETARFKTQGLAESTLTLAIKELTST